eukprot:TRINITY_DN57167_c0_g1_i1.p2 TRINITY_DN57167_c0_g1~~TRINITY_DN57167_c0_g1_i1.p2  ORF type:complete len:115 (-),score=24.34 TRINITY_DN57167_c0_g1_i1:36-380(-)
MAGLPAAAASAVPAKPSALGDVLDLGSASFVRVDNKARLDAYTRPGAKLTVIHAVPGHGGYFMVPDGNLLCGLIQWVVNKDTGAVVPQYWMEKEEYDSYVAQSAQAALSSPAKR